MSDTSGLPRWTRVAAYALCTDGAQATSGSRRGAGRRTLCAQPARNAPRRREQVVLLVRIAPGYPAAGKWTLPGGGVKFGEDPEAAVLRELGEETGLTGVVSSIAAIDSRTRGAEPDRGIGEWHAIRIVYRVDVIGGELRDEIEESTDAAAWFTRVEAAALPTVDLVEVALRHLDDESSMRKQR